MAQINKPYISHPDKTSVTIQFNYKVLIIGASVTILLTLLLIWLAYLCNYNYEARDVVALVTCGIVTTGLIYNAMGLRLNYDTNKAKLDFDNYKFDYEKEQKDLDSKKKKVARSFEEATNWFSADMCRIVEHSRQFLLENEDILKNGNNDQLKALFANSRKRAPVLLVLNYFEYLSLLIKKDQADEETLMSCFKTLFVDYHKVLSKFIDEQQLVSKRYLMNYEEIANKWSKV